MTYSIYQKQHKIADVMRVGVIEDTGVVCYFLSEKQYRVRVALHTFIPATMSI